MKNYPYDLQWLGMDPASPQAHWLGSAAFACVRALVLPGLSVVLFVRLTGTAQPGSEKK